MITTHTTRFFFTFVFVVICFSEANVISPKTSVETIELREATKFIYRTGASRREYLMAPFKMSFSAGEKFCSDYGMQLVAIDKEITDIEVMTVLTGQNANDGWTSGKCTSANCATGIWTSTNTPFSSGSYKNWGAGQPGQLAGCICYERNPLSAYSWAVDANCNNKKNVVCGSIEPSC